MVTLTTKKKKEMRAIAKERGCKCKDEDYWFQLRYGDIGCNRCECLIITEAEYKRIKSKDE